MKMEAYIAVLAFLLSIGVAIYTIINNNATRKIARTANEIAGEALRTAKEEIELQYKSPFNLDISTAARLTITHSYLGTDLSLPFTIYNSGAKPGSIISIVGYLQENDNRPSKCHTVQLIDSNGPKQFQPVSDANPILLEPKDFISINSVFRSTEDIIQGRYKLTIELETFDQRESSDAILTITFYIAEQHEDLINEGSGLHITGSWGVKKNAI